MRIIPIFAVLAVILTGCSVPPWKEYVYPAWGFAASFRVPPKVTERPATPDGSIPRNVVVEAVQGGRDMVIMVTDASTTTKSDQQILTEVPEAMARDGKVGVPTYVAIGQVVGREVTFDKPGQSSELVRIFVANHKLYELTAQSPLGTDDTEVTDFLGRVRLLSQ